MSVLINRRPLVVSACLLSFTLCSAGAAEERVEPGGIGIQDEAVLAIARDAGASEVTPGEPDVGVSRFKMRLGRHTVLLTNDRSEGCMVLRFSWQEEREPGEDDYLRVNMWNQEPDVGRATLLQLPLNGKLFLIWVLEDEFEFHADVPKTATVDFIRSYAYLAERFEGYAKGDNEVVPNLDSKPGDIIPIRQAGPEVPGAEAAPDNNAHPRKASLPIESPASDRPRLSSELDQPLSVATGSTGGNLAEIGARLGDRDLLYRSIALLELAVERAPKDERLVTQLADAYVATEREPALVQALRIYRSQLAAHPDAPELLARIADAYHQLGNTSDALKFAARRASLPQASNRLAGCLQIAIITTDAGQPATGLALVEPLHQRHPDDHGVTLLTATLQFGAGRDSDARILLTSLIERLPGDHPAAVKAQSLLDRHTSQK